MSTSPPTIADAAHAKTSPAPKVDDAPDDASKDAKADSPAEVVVEAKEPAAEAEKKAASPKAVPVKVEAPKPRADEAHAESPEPDEEYDAADAKPKAASPTADDSPKPKAELKESSPVKEEPSSDDDAPTDPPTPKAKSPKNSDKSSPGKSPKSKKSKSSTTTSSPGPARKKQKMYTPLLPTTSRTRVYQSTSTPKEDSTKLNFAQRLMELLEKDDVHPCLHWMEDGKSICIVDPVRFANEVMPKYFSDTKYKSFMVRMKRWGFKTSTPKDGHGAKIMKCELFRRDQPELCLLMGDERRVDRINVAKDITKRAEKREEEAAAAVAAAAAARAPPAEARHSIEAEVVAAGRHSHDAAQRVAMMEHQRRNDMAALGMLTGRYPGSSYGMYPPMAVSSAGILPQSSAFLGMGPDPLLGLRGYEGLRMDENMSNLSINDLEEEIRRCLETIHRCQETLAVTRSRLAMFQTVRETRLMQGSARGLAMLSEHCHQ